MFKVHGRGRGRGADLVRVGDVEAAVDGALESAEDLGAGSGADEPNIQDAGERPAVALRLHQEVLAVRRLLALVLLIHPQLLEQAPRDEQAGAVARGIVGEANLDAVLGQLVRIGGRQTDVTHNLGVHDLADDILRRPVQREHQNAGQPDHRQAPPAHQW
eukprot:scaffold10393_cov114-Isochrysis_galbana.AAC.3